MATWSSIRWRRRVFVITVLVLSGCGGPRITTPRPALVAAPTQPPADRVAEPAPAPRSPPRSPSQQAASGAQPYLATLASWPEHAKAAAQAMVKAYGPPAQFTFDQLVWFDAGPFKRTIVHRDEVAHDFPSPHVDVLEQVIDLKVPQDKLADLAAFDGSLSVSRTRGEVAALGDSEGMNLLALNLANEILIGHDTVAQARASFATVARLHDSQGPQPFTSGLAFKVPRGGTADRDAEPAAATAPAADAASRPDPAAADAAAKLDPEAADAAAAKPDPEAADAAAKPDPEAADSLDSADDAAKHTN